MAVTVYKVVRIVDGKYVSSNVNGTYQLVYEPGKEVAPRFPVFVFPDRDLAEWYRRMLAGGQHAILECRAERVRPVGLVALLDGSDLDEMAIESYWAGGKVLLFPAPWGSVVADKLEVLRRVA